MEGVWRGFVFFLRFGFFKFLVVIFRDGGRIVI